MRLYFSILLMVFSVAAFGQGKVTFEAFTDAREVVEGNTFQVSFNLKNANGVDFSPPSFKPFKVISGPNRSISNSIINGTVSSEMTISYMLLAERQGNFLIKSGKVKANNKQLLSKPFRVKVVKARKQAPGVTAGEPIFVVAEFADSVAYVGQQVLLDYKIFTKKNIESYNLIAESDYDGLFNTEVRRFNNQATKIALNGEQYVTQIIKRVALFPQQTGEYLISPLRLRVGIDEEKGNQRRRRSFFFRNLKYENIGSKSTNLKVIPLPPDAPNDFCGAIGTYQVKASLSPTNLTTDDAVSVSMEIRGNGDARQVIPSNFKWPDGFEIYDPKVKKEESGENGGEIQHYKIVEFLALPTEKGNFQIQPSASYFDTDSAKYIQLAIKPVNITVRQGTNKPGRTNVSPRKVETEDIQPIKTETTLKSFGKPFFGSVIYWLLFLLPILVYGFLFYKNKKAAERADIDPLEQKRIKAQRVAQKKLTTAKVFLDQNKSSQFYDEIANATLGYVGDKLNIPLSKMSKSNVEEKLNSLKVESSLITRFMEILKTTEMARFGGGGNVDAMQKIYSETSEVLTEMESAIG